MPFFPSERVKNIQSPPIVLLNTLASKLEGVISLGQGVPCFTPPEIIYQALFEEMQNTKTHIYSPDMGLEDLRLILSSLLQEKKQGSYQLEEIMITAGASQAFINVCLTILDVGDEVLLPSPFYFNHAMAIEAVGARPVEWPMQIKAGTFSLDLEQLPELITSHTKVIVIISPNNPTGCVYSNSAIKKTLKIAQEKDLFVIFDNTYIDFNFIDETYNFSKLKEFSDRIIHIGSFSKSLGMSGWRCGYIAARGIMEELLKIQDTLVICAPVISQLAVIGALRWSGYSAFLQEKKQELRERGEYLVKRLREISFLEGGEIQGAFYVFPKIQIKKPIFSEKLALNLLKEAKVLTIPGSAFGTAGEGFLRLSYGFPNIATVETAIERLKFFQKKYI